MAADDRRADPDRAAPTTLPRVRVVTLNWNAAELTARCLRSLLATDWDPARLEIVVVDNASIDGSYERLRSWFDRRVHFVANPTNLGFAEGCNTALRDLGDCDYVALVNNDATVDPGWLAPLVEALERDPQLGAACPKLLFSTPYVPVEVTVRSPGEIVGVTVDGIDVTHRCLWGDGIHSVPDPVVALAHHRLVEDRAVLHVPVSARDGATGRLRVTIRTADPAEVRCGHSSTRAEPDGPVAVAHLDAAAAPVWRINNLGTDRTAHQEGIDRRFGEADDPGLGAEEVEGWCGGGVLLRPAYLDQVGRFDPRFFAYYEDTDLSWRGRRAGWRYRTEPRSVVRHVHGGTAGSSTRGFFFLNYRNWILTALRSGDRGQIASALRWARHLAWGPTRANVLSRLKHGRVPDTRLTRAWVRVAAGVMARTVPVLRSRSSPHRIGLRPATRVRSRLQARPVPRPPAPRLDGPTVVYVDVTSALDGGWRAGIQRVTVELVRRLPVVADVDVVAVRWSDPLGTYRRLDAAEWRSLLDPHHHPPPPTSPGPARRLAARLRRILTRPPAVSRAVQGLRRRIQPARHAALVLPRFEPGAVFLDIDASWNVVQAPRAELLPALHRDGVRVAWFAHDLFPETHPEWFDPGLVRVFREHLRAHADHAEVVVCNSEHTAGQVRAFVTDRHPGALPRTVVVPLGADARPAPATAAGAATPDLPAAGPVLLTVGTVEPRKGHRHLLAAWDRIRAEHPGAVLVIAGRRGWHADDVAAAINDHPDLGRRLFWLTDLDDRALAAWYRRADLVVVPSLSEGYGLPVVEALGAGCAVLASDGGALAEVGGDRVRRFPAGDPEALAREAGALLADPEAVEGLRRRAATWEPPSWDDTARAVAAALGAEVFDTGDVPVPTARG